MKILMLLSIGLWLVFCNVVIVSVVGEANPGTRIMARIAGFVPLIVLGIVGAKIGSKEPSISDAEKDEILERARRGELR